MSNCSGTSYGYKVEARLKGKLMHPLRLGDRFFITEEWRTVPIEASPIGVPNDVLLPWLSRHADLMSYECANAMAAWAAAEARLSIELRLVKFKLTYSWAVSTEGYGQPFSYDEMQRDAAWEPAPKELEGQ